MPWYCLIRTHEHSTEWEAEACTELYERWEEAVALLMTAVREDEVAWQVDRALSQTPDPKEDA